MLSGGIGAKINAPTFASLQRLGTGSQEALPLYSIHKILLLGMWQGWKIPQNTPYIYLQKLYIYLRQDCTLEALVDTMPFKNIIVAPFGCTINYQMSMDTSSKKSKFLNENHRVMVSWSYVFCSISGSFHQLRNPEPLTPPKILSLDCHRCR